MKELDVVFGKYNIEFYGFIPISQTDIIAPRLLPEFAAGCVVFLAPYYFDYKIEDGYNFSRYARARDYHKFFDALYEKLIPDLQKAFPRDEFRGFADRSPVNEKKAAAAAGLGCIGKNSLLINPVYGSYVFIGSIITSATAPPAEIYASRCEGCGKCEEECPVSALADGKPDRTRCLSAISQKKEKTGGEKKILRETKTVWGCDICQRVCPMNKNKKETNVEYFKSGLIKRLTPELLAGMDRELFDSYPFSYRDKSRIIENIENIDKFH